MDEQRFWSIIEAARRGADDDVDEYAKALATELRRETPQEVAAFEEILDRVIASAYHWPLWGAAYVINGGCSDDGFYYFRGWLVMQGEAVFRKALADPDSLADVLQDDVDAECEEMLYVAGYVYEEKTGSELSLAGMAHDPVTGPTGESWEEEDLPRLLPRLSALRWE